MASDVKDTKPTRHISRINHFVMNDEECNYHKTVWCEGGLQMAYIDNNNVREDYFNHRLGYAMLIIEIL